MSTTPSQRDIDIRIVSEMSMCAEDENNFFVLTGSYSIDALTGADIKHNDIDANIFTANIPTALGKTAALLQTCVGDMELTKQTGGRLEYLYPHQYGTTQVEIQFVQYDSLVQGDDGTDFILSHRDSHKVVVPTVRANLSETNGHEHAVTIKSLPFAIGTWALRISGVALDQKRAVRESDIRHFAFLASMPHDRAATLNAIRYHPQMPDDCRADDILSKSYEILERRKEA